MSGQTQRKALRKMIADWDCTKETAERLGITKKEAARRITDDLPWEMINGDAGADKGFRVARVVNRTARALREKSPLGFPECDVPELLN